MAKIKSRSRARPEKDDEDDARRSEPRRSEPRRSKRAPREETDGVRRARRGRDADDDGSEPSSRAGPRGRGDLDATDDVGMPPPRDAFPGESDEARHAAALRAPPRPRPPPGPPARPKSLHDLIVDDVEHALRRYHDRRRPRDASLSIQRGAKLLHDTYAPDVVVRRGLGIDAIVEVEDKASWRTLLGTCIAADYVLGVEDAASPRVGLFFVVPDERSDAHLKLYEMRLCWARDYCSRIHVRKVMRISTFVAYWNQLLAAEEARREARDDDGSSEGAT